jgi:hypothetical protein
MSTARNIAVRSLALVAVACLCTSASAGPLNELSVAAGVDSAYDSNVFNGRGPDFVNRIDPHASYRLIDPRYKLEASYDLGYWTYAFGKAANSINHRADVAVEGWATRRLFLHADDEFSRAEDPGFLSRIGVVAPQIGIFDNVADANAGFNITRRVYGGLGYTYHWARFDGYTPMQAMTYPALFDGAEHDAAANLGFKVTRLDDLRFQGRFQDFTAGPQATDANMWNIGATYSPTLGWRHQIVRDLEVTADAGPLFYQALHDSVNIVDASGHVVAPGSGVTYRLAGLLRYYTPTWRASASYTHDLVGATGAGTALWADYVYAQGGYHFLEKFDAHLGAGYFRNGIAPSNVWSYDGVTGDVIADYRVINNLRLGAYYQVRWQRTGPGAIGAVAATQFPSVLRNIVGIRLLAVLGADARPPRREVHQ